MKADKIKLALEKLKEAKVKKVRNTDLQAAPLSLTSDNITANDAMLKLAMALFLLFARGINQSHHPAGQHRFLRQI